MENKKLSNDERIQKIKELYKEELSEDAIDKLSGLASIYGGTVLTKAILDLYDSLIYGEEPRGPKVNIKDFF